MSDPAPGSDPTAVPLHGAPRSTGDTPRNRVAAAVRRVAEVLVGHPVEAGDLEAAAEALEKVAGDLEGAAAPGKAMRGQPDAAGHPQDYFPTSPVIGYANPLAPPVDLWAVTGDDGQPELRGRAVFGYPYEGPPTCVHGGVIAELFDELLGSVNILLGKGGFTGTLTVRYRRPTPLFSELELRARRTKVEGRKIFAWGGIFHEGELTAEAEGIFIEVGPQQMASIVGHNAAAATAAVMDNQWAEFVRRHGEGDPPGPAPAP